MWARDAVEIVGRVPQLLLSHLPVSGQHAVLGTVARQSADVRHLDFCSNRGESGKPEGSRNVSSGGGNRRRRGGWRSWRDDGRKKRSGGGRRRRRGEWRGSRSVLGGVLARTLVLCHLAESGAWGQKACLMHTQKFRTLEVRECRNSWNHSR